jgi:hypothetical protein
MNTKFTMESEIRNCVGHWADVVIIVANNVVEVAFYSVVAWMLHERASRLFSSFLPNADAAHGKPTLVSGCG